MQSTRGGSDMGYDTMQYQPRQSQDSLQQNFGRNGFGSRFKKQRSSMSCNDYGSENFGMHNYRRRTTDQLNDPRSISKEANSLELMGVSPDRQLDDVAKLHENFQSTYMTQAPQPVPMPQIGNNEQMSQLTQLLSQFNMNIVNSQIANMSDQKSVPAEKRENDQTQHSTQAGTKSTKGSMSIKQTDPQSTNDPQPTPKPVKKATEKKPKEANSTKISKPKKPIKSKKPPKEVSPQTGTSYTSNDT